MAESNMIKGKNFIFFGLQSWDTEIGSNCKNMAEEVSKHNHVLYVNRPPDRYTLWKSSSSAEVAHRKKVIRGEINAIEQIHDSLWVYTPPVLLDSVNWIPFGPLFDYFNKINSKKIASAIRQATEELGFTSYYLFNDNEFLRGLYLSDVLKPSLLIYYIRDFLLAQAYFKRHGSRTEPAIIKKSNVAVANSTYLANYARSFNSNSYFIGQGCDLSSFDPQAYKTIPIDIQPIKHPIIGYAGALLGFRLDIDIIRHVATSRPNWSIVLVGPEDDAFKQSDLHTIPNIHFLGHKPFDEIPAYINSFDICINPQVINLNTIGNYPRKVDEYLAMGKPVVATATEAMEMFADCTYLCKDKHEYVSQIEKALQEDAIVLQQKRRQFALQHTWENNVAELYKAIEATEQMV